MKAWIAALMLFGAASAFAAERNPPTGDVAGAKSAAIEAARLRLGPNPTLAATSALIEAEEALRRYRQAKPEKRLEAQAVLDAAIARLQMEAELRRPARE